MKFEYFKDPSYYDMICLRPVANKNFCETLHFTNEKELNYTVQTISKWFNVDIELVKC